MTQAPKGLYLALEVEEEDGRCHIIEWWRGRLDEEAEPARPVCRLSRLSTFVVVVTRIRSGYLNVSLTPCSRFLDPEASTSIDGGLVSLRLSFCYQPNRDKRQNWRISGKSRPQNFSFPSSTRPLDSAAQHIKAQPAWPSVSCLLCLPIDAVSDFVARRRISEVP